MKSLQLTIILKLSLMCWFGASLSAQQLAAADLEESSPAIHQETQRPSEKILLADALEELSEKYQVFFTYNTDHLKAYRVGTAYRSGKGAKKSLRLLLDRTGLTFKQRGKQNFVIVRPATKPRSIDILSRAAIPVPEVSGGLTPGTEAIVDQVISGRIVEAGTEIGLPGVTVQVKNLGTGTVSDIDGRYSLTVPEEAKTLLFSFTGFRTQEVAINGRSIIDIELAESVEALSEIVVVGYGTQKKSDITGAVTSVPKDRLEMVPNLSVAQAIQGSIPGVQVSTGSAGASPNGNSIIVRGRNSIRAGNGPLIVLDGFPYGGVLSDINPNDIESIEVLKDASSAAIYGSRGANGVILVTTKAGALGKPTIGYDGFYTTQRITNFPDILTGEEFYEFKRTRDEPSLTQTEEDIFNNRSWSNWQDLALRNGESQQHNLSISGGSENTKYYIAASYLDVKGLAVNDKFTRVTNRINLDTDIADWLTIGTRTTFSYDDESGLSPSFSGITFINPLTEAFEEDGSLAIYPNKENPNVQNPLQGTLASNSDKSYQVVSNNFVRIDLPFIPGLDYTLNAGVRYKFSDNATYFGRNTAIGLENRGQSNTFRGKIFSSTIENIINYRRDIGKSNVFLTGLYSFQDNEFSGASLAARGFPTDILEEYAAGQADLIEPSYGFNKSNIISQMLRFNYTYDGRYLLTATGRRDGYSGFGAADKWGLFPSVALGWNISRESFFPTDGIVNNLKLRLSWGQNGNQAVGSYETISRFGTNNWVSGAQTQAGYVPNRLGLDDLGWETTESINIGLDYGLWEDRIYGDLNFYKSNTTDLLLNRSISSVHGIGSVTQNIGEVQNVGFEASINSRNITGADFRWTTNANASFVNNKIVSLYGLLDEDNQEIDDLENRWFIGEPIRVNYGHRVVGVWQLDEVEEADRYGSIPGDVKLEDLDDDGDIDGDDQMLLGQQDPDFFWGLTNSFEYKNFVLRIFVHGVHGVTRRNDLLRDNVFTDVSRNTTRKNWWTPDNPTNEFYANRDGAEQMGGGTANYFENASFIRFKDVTLGYDLPTKFMSRIGLSRLRVYLTGRNLFTITDFGGLDPELNSNRAVPLQKEYVFGVNVNL